MSRRLVSWVRPERISSPMISTAAVTRSAAPLAMPSALACQEPPLPAPDYSGGRLFRNRPGPGVASAGDAIHRLDHAVIDRRRVVQGHGHLGQQAGELLLVGD